MLILPAIDLLEGRCVRLARGSYDDVTVYSDDPAAVAADYATAGAAWLHVVDLDGARNGRPHHPELVRRITEAFPGSVQVGGGLRTDADVEAALASGAARVVLGTAAIRRPRWLSALIRRLGVSRIAAAVDLRGRRVLTEGWYEEADSPLEGLLDVLADTGLEVVVFTDTERDGMLGSPNAARTVDFVRAGFETIVAGGVTTADDVRRLREAGAHGAIIGSALYERRLTLEDALRAAGRGTTC